MNVLRIVFALFLMGLGIGHTCVALAAPTSSTAYSVKVMPQVTAGSVVTQIPITPAASAVPTMHLLSWQGVALATVVGIIVGVYAPQFAWYVALILTTLVAIADQVVEDYRSGRLGAAWQKIRSCILSRAPWWLRRMV